MQLLRSALKKNLLAMFTLKGAEYLASFITLPYLLRVLGPETYGTLTFYQVVMGYVVLFADYGFPLTAPRDVAQSSEEEIPRVFSAVLGTRLGLMAAGVAFVCVMVLFLPEATGAELLLWMLPALVGSALFPSWYFQGIQRMKYITILSVTARCLGAAGVFLWVRGGQDVRWAAFFLAVPQLIAGILSLGLLLVRARGLFGRPSWEMMRRELAGGWSVFLSTLFMQAYTNGNLLILRLFTDDYVVGCYAAAHKFIEAVKGLLVPISNAVYPHVSQLAMQSREQAVSFLRRMLLMVGGGMGAASVVACVGAEEIIFLLMGKVYPESVAILRILSLVPFLVGVSNVLGIQTMLAFRLQQSFQRIVMYSAVLNVCVVWWMILLWQGVGLAVTTVMVEGFVTLAMAVALHRARLVV